MGTPKYSPKQYLTDAEKAELYPDPIALAQVALTRCQSAKEHDALIDFLAQEMENGNV